MLIQKRSTPLPPIPLTSSLSAWVLDHTRRRRHAEKAKKRARDAKYLETLMASLGKTQGAMGATGLWEPAVLMSNEVWATIPLLGAMMRSVQKEGIKSKPLYDFEADFSDVDAQELGRYAATKIEYYTKKFFTPQREQQEILRSICAGFGVSEEYWDPDEGDPQTLLGVACQRCGLTGEIPEAGAREDPIECPDQECQAAAAFAGAGPSLLKRTGESRATPPGDVVLRSIDPFCIDSNTWADDESPAVWRRIDEILDVAVWDRYHPDIEVPGKATGMNLGEEFLHLRRFRSYQRAQAGVESLTSNARARSELMTEVDVIRSRDFLSPDTYRRLVTTVAETLPSGRVIPKDAPLVALFPDGLCALRQGDGPFLDIYPEVFKGRIKVWNYSVKPGDAWGSSTAAQALECQYLLEEDLSELQSTASEMTPQMFYDETLSDMRIGGQHKVPVHRRMTELGLDKLIYHSPPGVPSPVVFQLVLFYEQRMQGILAAWSPLGGGLPDAVGNTATGTLKASGEQESTQGMYLELRAFAKMDILYDALVLFRKHADIPRAVGMGGANADGAVLMMSKHMLPPRFSLSLKDSSWWPRDRGQKQQAEMTRYNMLLLGNQASMLLHGRPLNSVEIRYINSICGSEIGANLEQMAAEIAVKDWKKAKNFLKTAAANPSDQGVAPLLAQAKAQLDQAALEGAKQQKAAAMVSQIGSGQPPPMVPVPAVSPDEVVLTACDLAVPVRPGLSFALGSVADQLRAEALKTSTRALPDIFLAWLDRRADALDEAARSRRTANMAAMGPAAPQLGQPATGAPNADGSGQPIANMLLSKLAGGGGGNSDSTGLPPSPDIPQVPTAPGVQ